MPKYLVIANQTLGGQQLVRRISELAASAGSEPTQLHLVVPVTKTDGTHQWDYPPIDRYIPDATVLARTMAQARLDHEVERLRHEDIKADGEVTDNDPVDRAKALVAEQKFDAVLVSTLPHHLSKWLRTDLPSHLDRALDVPVEHVEGSAGPSV